MDGMDQRQQLGVSQATPISEATAFPRPVAADADRQHGAHFGQGVVRALGVDPGILHSASFAKYAVAFLRNTRISHWALRLQDQTKLRCSAV